MTKQDYINAGFKLSLQVDDAEITRAEADVRAAYIVPIVGETHDAEAETRAAIMALAFALMCRRKVFVTRAAGVVKNTAQSIRADEQEATADMAKTAHLRLEALRRASYAVNPKAEVLDVCGIYFKTNYFSL